MKKMYINLILIAVISLIIGFSVGFFLNLSRQNGTRDRELAQKKINRQDNITEWTCSMHPQIRQPKFGRCPICAMDLIPVSFSETYIQSHPNELKMSDTAIKLAEIETAPVIRRIASIEIRMSGKVALDETKLAHISARFPGRIDKLFVNYTGAVVKKGDHIAEIFSPDLLVAQQEVLIALKRDSNQSALRAVKEKFRRWGFPEYQVDEIIQKGEVTDHLTIYSPIAGIVIEKNALEGGYFNAEDRLFTIADLNQVWINLDAFESDLFWIKYGQKVDFFAEALPGKSFSGRVAFISPVLDERTRTVKIRLNAPNEDGFLKPGYFVRAILSAKIAGKNRIFEPSLKGKWISPMHPEIIKDAPGKCDVCGVELVSAESLGFTVSPLEKSDLPLLIPASAPLITGKRAIVYIDKGQSNYEAREVILGPKAGDYYIVESGLNENEMVVVKGNFKIDSAMQLLAKKSLISSMKESEENYLRISQDGDSHQSRIYLDPPMEDVLDAYFATQKALASDDLKTAIEKVSVADKFYGTSLAKSTDINIARERFSELTAKLYDHISQAKIKPQRKIYRFFCPMAFGNKGGYWLQDDAKIANPYFGSVMLRCGEKIDM